MNLPALFRWRRLTVGCALCLTGFTAAADDLPVLPAVPLQQATLWHFDPASATPLRGWHSLAPGQVDAGAAAADCGLRLSYALPPANPLDLAEAGGEFALQLDLGGIDTTPYDHLSFRIRGDGAAGFDREIEAQLRRRDPSGGPRTEIGGIRVGGIGATWKQVEVALPHFLGLSEPRRFDAFVIALPSRNMQVREGVYCIDDVSLIRTGTPVAGPHDPVVAQRKKAWEDAAGGEVAARPLLKARLAGWPTRPLVEPSSLPRDDTGFLRRLAADTWRGLDALTDRAHGLPLDRVEFIAGSVEPATTRIGDYTNITNIGLHFLAVTAAAELGFINRDQAVARLSTTLNSLESMATHRGFFYNYYNTTTLERTSAFVSFVDSSWLTAGLIVARQAFAELAPRCDRLIRQGDYRLFYDPKHQLMSHGHHANLGLDSTFHYGVFYAESRLGSLIAIGKGDVPEEHWFRMARTFPPEIQWQTRPPLARDEQSGGGFHWIGGHYRWRNYNYVPSWGGSLFEALMPRLVVDEDRHAPDSLGRNGALHVEIHRRYALEVLGYPVWGMSPSSTPGSGAYGEFGVRPLGMAGYKAGVVTPHAAALALLADPTAATANLRRLAERYPVYGDFGFYDAVNPLTGEVSPHYLCLNQAMILVALANHLKDHAIQKLYAADPIGAKTLPLLAIEKFPR